MGNEATDREYVISAFTEVLYNDVPLSLAWEAVSLTTTGKQFDEAIQAAIQAQDWLNKLHN